MCVNVKTSSHVLVWTGGEVGAEEQCYYEFPQSSNFYTTGKGLRYSLLRRLEELDDETLEQHFGWLLAIQDIVAEMEK